MYCIKDKPSTALLKLSFLILFSKVSHLHELYVKIEVMVIILTKPNSMTIVIEAIPFFSF